MSVIKSFKNLTKFELSLWLISVAAIIATCLAFGAQNLLSASASLIGVTALIFVAKGDVLGQILTIVFSIFYGVISFWCRYYGEMITYMGMTAPMAVMAVVSWIRHPYKKNSHEVEVNRLKLPEIVLMLIISLLVTVAFYFILSAFNTANLTVSTFSVTTSFIASYLTFRRSEYYALAYAANDIVLIFLWISASLSDAKYMSMIICFAMFFVNDIYGFVNWSRMKKRQNIVKTD